MQFPIYTSDYHVKEQPQLVPKGPLLPPASSAEGKSCGKSLLPFMFATPMGNTSLKFNIREM